MFFFGTNIAANPVYIYIPSSCCKEIHPSHHHISTIFPSHLRCFSRRDRFSPPNLEVTFTTFEFGSRELTIPKRSRKRRIARYTDLCCYMQFFGYPLDLSRSPPNPTPPRKIKPTRSSNKNKFNGFVLLDTTIKRNLRSPKLHITPTSKTSLHFASEWLFFFSFPHKFRGATWRIIPVSKWLVTPLYKPFRPFGRGTTPVRGLTNHGY